MPSTLESCEKYFGTKNIYEIFGIEKTAIEKESEFGSMSTSPLNFTRKF